MKGKRKLRCSGPPEPGDDPERCTHCNRIIKKNWADMGGWHHLADWWLSDKGIDRERAYTKTGDVVHVRRDDYPNAAICGQRGLAEDAMPWEAVTCKKCQDKLN